MIHRFPAFRMAALILALAIPFAALAGPVGAGAAVGSQYQWSTNVSGHDRIMLRVLSPSGDVVVREYPAGQGLSLRVSDLGTNVEDGQYNYEFIVVPRVAPAVAKKLEAARAANDAAAARKALREAGLEPQSYSGTFTVQNGSFVSPSATEGGSGAEADMAAVRSDEPQPTKTASRPAGGKIGVNDQVIPDDLIVQGSACVGFDCVNNESFGFDTIRMKENNLRIKAEDTSTGSFPTSDWQLTFNDSASGGANKFSVEDITAATVPVTVEGATPSNALFVDSTGRIGFRTTTPVLDLHVSTSNTPAIRLEQTSAGGFTAQTWDVAGNEANFFVRDVTGGSRLPFRIRPGAPTSSLDIAAGGEVGIGTASPDTQLDVVRSIDANMGIEVGNTSTGTTANAFVRTEADVASVSFQSHSSTRTLSRFGQTLGSWNEMLATAGNGLILGTLSTTPLILGTNSSARLTIDSSGNITVPGNFTVTGVKNFAVADPADAKRALYYTALEGPEAGTYFRGSAKTVNGEVVIELPGYFSRLTEQERMTVQLTPVGGWGQLYVASKSPEKLVIKVAEGSNDLQFDYLVQGVRKGYLDYEVERTGAFPVNQ